ncbi:ATP-dependent helicase, partial [bacterium]|nr:ATP-dependent helicase [bacterium]
GRIDIRESYSTIDMQSGIPRHVWRLLKKVGIAGQELNISKVSDSRSKKEGKGRGKNTERMKRRSGPRRER